MIGALAEQIRGGVLLAICIAIGLFFFWDAGINIFGKKRPGGEKTVFEDRDTILFRVFYRNRPYGEDVFLSLDPEKQILVGFGEDCDLDLSVFPLPVKTGPEVWFRVMKNAAGVLMLVKDPTMDGLRVRDPDDKAYRALNREWLKDALQVEKDELVIRMEKQL